MTLDLSAAARIDALLVEATVLSRGYGQYAQIRDHVHGGQCVAWLQAAASIAAFVVSDPNNPYRRTIDACSRSGNSMVVNKAVGEAAAILRRLRDDAVAGFIASAADVASAQTFDDLLDHAQAYLGDGRKEPAGTLAGVVFEDSARRVYRKVSGLDDSGKDIEAIINHLKGNPSGTPTLSGTQAKRAKVAAHVRTKATHAQWSEFEASDVSEAIRFTREFVEKHLAT